MGRKTMADLRNADHARYEALDKLETTLSGVEENLQKLDVRVSLLSHRSSKWKICLGSKELATAGNVVTSCVMCGLQTGNLFWGFLKYTLEVSDAK